MAGFQEMEGVPEERGLDMRIALYRDRNGYRVLKIWNGDLSDAEVDGWSI